MVILIQFVTCIGNKTFVRKFDIALVCVLFVYGVQSETFFGQVTTYSEICCSFRGKQICYIHQYLCLCVWLKHIQYIVAYYCVKFTVGEIGAIIVIISNNVVPLLMEFISIKTKPTAEVKYFPFQQFVLQEVSCRHRKVCPFDSG